MNNIQELLMIAALRALQQGQQPNAGNEWQTAHEQIRMPSVTAAAGGSAQPSLPFAPAMQSMQSMTAYQQFNASSLHPFFASFMQPLPTAPPSGAMFPLQSLTSVSATTVDAGPNAAAVGSACVLPEVNSSATAATLSKADDSLTSAANSASSARDSPLNSAISTASCSGKTQEVCQLPANDLLSSAGSSPEHDAQSSQFTLKAIEWKGVEEDDSKPSCSKSEAKSTIPENLKKPRTSKNYPWGMDDLSEDNSSDKSDVDRPAKRKKGRGGKGCSASVLEENSQLSEDDNVQGKKTGPKPEKEKLKTDNKPQQKPEKRGRGRPKGSLNKNKTCSTDDSVTVTISDDEEENFQCLNREAEEAREVHCWLCESNLPTVKLSCRHVFCPPCAKSWKGTSKASTCPICLKKISSAEYLYFA